VGQGREEAMRETHVPTQHPQAQQDARLSRAHADARRPSRHQGPTPARPHPPVGLIRRIRDRATFAALARAPRRRHGPVTLRFVPSAEALPARVAFTTTRAGAVTRNRIRRRLRAAVTTHQSTLTPGGAYLFGGTRDAATVPFTTLVDAVGRLTGDAHGGDPA
jgi:ribonuclease P protein component